MNYQKIYDSLIEKAKSENRVKLKKSDANYIFYHNHHIIPKCMDGDNEKENIQLLTVKEHYFCHKLLTYIYLKHKGNAWAFHRMTFSKKYGKIASGRDYAYAIELTKEFNSKNFSEYNTAHKKGKSYEQQMIEKYGEKEGVKKGEEYRNKICKNTTGENNPMYNISVYDTWIEKYGEEIANKKYENMLQDMRISRRFRKLKLQENDVLTYISLISKKKKK